MKYLAGILLTIALLAAASQATIRTVNQLGTANHVTISAAISAAVTGDTILVSPGTYSEDLVISGKRLTLIGAGWDQVTVNSGASSAITVGNTTQGTVIEGFDFVSVNRAYNSTQLTTDSITVRRCRLRGGNPTVDLSPVRRHTFEDCLITSNANGTLIETSTQTNATLVMKGCQLGFTGGTQTATTFFDANNISPVEITNCTFVSVRRVFNLTGTQPVIAINNIFYDWTGTTTWGTFLAGSVFDYNASDATAPAIPGGFTNHILLGTDDPFVNYDEALNYEHGTSDLHLNGGAGGLALTDAGNPLILDTDASQSDVGAYGGPTPLVDNGVPAYPFVLDLSIPNLIETGDDLNVSSTGRVGPRY